MSYFGLSQIAFVSLIIYSVISFIITLSKPKIGLFLTIPIIALGFANTFVIKGGFIALVGLAMVLNTLITKKDFKIDKKIIPFILLCLLFVLWVCFRSIFDTQGLDVWIFWSIKRIVVPGLLAILVVFFVRTEDDFFNFLLCVFGFSVVNSMFGILQYFSHLDVFWLPRESLGVPGDIAYQIKSRVRITGLSSFVITLAYQLLSVLPIFIATTWIKTKNISIKIFHFIGIPVVFLGIILTFLRAGIGGAILGSFLVFVLLFGSKLLKKRNIAFIFIGIFIFSSLLIFNKNIQQKVFLIGGTIIERVPISLAATRLLVLNPLGTGLSYNEQVGDIYSNISDLPGSALSKVQYPHNIILNTGVILGVPALLIMILFYFLLFKNLFNVYKREKGNLKIIAIGLIGSFVAYVFNAMFHNNSPFFGDAFNWFLIGLSFALINVSYLNNKDLT